MAQTFGNKNNQIMNWDDFKTRYGISRTTNFDLMDIAKDLQLKVKVVMHNELLKIPKTTKYVIMNLDSSKNAGTHWVAIFNTPDYKLYFSSFGDPPSDNVIKFMNKTTTKTTVREYSDFLIQEFDTEYCGQISLFVLMCLNKGISADEVVLDLKTAAMPSK